MSTKNTPPVAQEATKGGRTTVGRGDQFSTTTRLNQVASFAEPYSRTPIEAIVARVASDLTGRLRYAPARKRFERFNGAEWVFDNGSDVSGVLMTLANEVAKRYANAPQKMKSAAHREGLYLCSAACLTTVVNRLKQSSLKVAR